VTLAGPACEKFGTSAVELRETARGGAEHAATMRTIRHFWELWVATPTPLKVLYFALACGLAAGLAAAIGDFEFGSNGGRQVMDFVEGLLVIVLIVGAPVLVLGLIMQVVHLATMSGSNAGAPIQPFDQSKGDNPRWPGLM